MKKLSFLFLALAMITGSVFAQRDMGGSINLRDGRTTVRINVGDDRDDRDMLMRIRRLEQAVRDLQDKVYDLQSAPRTQQVVVCSGDFFSVGMVMAKAPSEIEARGSVIAQCQAKNGGIFCKDRDIKCQASIQ